MGIPPALLDLLLALLPDVRVLPVSRQARIRSRYRNAVGLAVQPGPHGALQYLRTLITNPVQFFANLWGHTALYVRVDGVIVRVIGFDPDRFLMFREFLGLGRAVGSGEVPTEGIVYDEERMFRSPDLRIAEFELGRDAARKLLRHLPRAGSAITTDITGLPYLYVTRGGQRLRRRLDARTFANCIVFLQRLLAQEGVGLSLLAQPPTARALAPIGPSQGDLTRILLGTDPRLLELRGRGTRRQPVFLRPHPLSRAFGSQVNLFRTVSGFRVMIANPVRQAAFILEHAGILRFDPSAALAPVGAYLSAPGSLAGSVAAWLGPLLEWVEANTSLSLLNPLHEPSLYTDYILCAELISDFLLDTLPADFVRTRAGLQAVHGVTAVAAWLLAVGSLYGDPLTAIRMVFSLLAIFLVIG